MNKSRAGVDPRAVVSPEAQLAEDVTVGAFAIVGEHVTLGPGTIVGPHAVVTGHTRLGSRNRIYQFASIGDAPQDKKYKGEPTRLEIGDGNVFRENCTVNRGTMHGAGVTRIGDDNLFMTSTHVAHDCLVGSHCVFANVATLGGHVEVGDYVIMGGMSGVHQFCKIGAHAFIANNAAVTRDVPPYVMAVGQPAEPHSINATGLSRRGFTAEQVRSIKNAYRVLYRSDLKLADALTRLQEAADSQPEVAAFVEFIGRSSRSLVR